MRYSVWLLSVNRCFTLQFVLLVVTLCLLYSSGASCKFKLRCEGVFWQQTQTHLIQYPIYLTLPLAGLNIIYIKRLTRLAGWLVDGVIKSAVSCKHVLANYQIDRHYNHVSKINNNYTCFTSTFNKIICNTYLRSLLPFSIVQMSVYAAVGGSIGGTLLLVLVVVAMLLKRSYSCLL